MKRPDKLEVLFKTNEALEHEAAEYCSSVREVYEQRQGVLDEVLEKKNCLKAKIKNIVGKKRRNALQAGSAKGAVELTSYRQRLNLELEKLETQVEKHTKALRLAQVRLDLAEQDLVEARIEKKKVAHLLENRREERLRTHLARDEAIIDELASTRSQK